LKLSLNTANGTFPFLIPLQGLGVLS